MHRITLRERFLDDLEAIQAHVSTDDPGAAERLVPRILGRVRELATHPHLGRPGRVSNTRELVVVGTPYVVPYWQPRPGEIEILAVIHGARRWPGDFPG